MITPTRAGRFGLCHACDRLTRRPGGVAACGCDGRGIDAHAAAGDCPLGRYDGLRRVSLAVLPAFLADRMRTCGSCDRRRGDRCGVLLDRGLAGYLMHPTRGLPSPTSRCPDDPPRWGPAASA